MALSSNGLGRRSLKSEIWVRFPLVLLWYRIHTSCRLISTNDEKLGSGENPHRRRFSERLVLDAVKSPEHGVVVEW